MDISNMNADDLKNAGELVNTAAKSFLGKKLIEFIGNRFKRTSNRKDTQSTIIDEHTKVISSAEAEVKAEIIRFNAELEKGGILADYIKRTGGHLISEQIRKDFNVDKAVSMAVDQLDNDREGAKNPSEEPIAEDWFTRWTSTVEDISDENIQRIWASILAGEVKSPGSFSLRSLDIVRNLSRTEAETFTKFCNFVLVSNGDLKFTFTKNQETPVEINEAIGIQGMRSLEEAGLISPSSSTIFNGVQINLFPSKVPGDPVGFSYGNLHINITPKINTNGDYLEGVITLTQAGKELHNLVSITPDSRYLRTIKEIYLSKVEITMSVHEIISREKDQYSYKKLGVII